MKSIVFALAAMAAGGCIAAQAASADAHPFNVHDLVMMDRVGAPVLSPDGATVAFDVRSTDYKANKGVHRIWVVAVKGGAPHAITDKALDANSPTWSADGKWVYFLAAKDGVTQLWRTAATGERVPEQLSTLPLDINSFKLSSDGKHIAMSIDVFVDCDDLACTRKRLDARKADPASGHLYTQLFERHWDTWSDGRRAQLFAADVSDGGKLGKLRWLTRGMDADVPSKPFGDNSEYNFSPNGKTIYFDARNAGHAEAWSTNFDIYSVPTDATSAAQNLTADNQAWDAWPLPSHDGKTLYYLAMRTPGFEADRLGIMALDLASGTSHEIDPRWDRSAGPLKLSADGKTLYTGADDEGNHALFAVDIASGEVSRVLGDGTLKGFDVAHQQIVAARQDFKHPTDLYAINDGVLRQITHFNAKRLANIEFGDVEWFRFPGWNNESVQGYVMKPVGYQKGKKYPVAFLIHGGPQGAWTADFHYRWNPETYAGQGFAVVAINFHGSTGYGQAFTDAISRHWGDRPLEDLKKGWAAALDKYAFLDGDRACALGASYGGYMVYWMAGVWNAPWKCFVDHDGVFNTRAMYYSTDELWFEEHENGGPEYQNPAAYEKFNPLNHVKDWKVPMLVVHSDHDYRIPLAEGIGAFTALQRQGIPSEFLRFPDESHWVNKPHNSVQWHNTVNAWIERWTKPASKD